MNAPHSLCSRLIHRAAPTLFIFLAGGIVAPAFAQSAAPPVLTVDWNHTIATAQTTITLQVVENPPLRRGSPIHDAAWANLEALHTEMTRLALWYPYPRMAVAELSPPTPRQTSWDFSAIDPIVEDFFAATSNRTSVFTMSTIPTWMFQQADPGPVPSSPDDAMWNYEAGTTLRDLAGNKVADYFARVARWYTSGGFTDELGRHRASPYHYRIAWWEVLNEPEYEHAFDIRAYTALYDRVVAAVHAVTPATRFVGMSLAEPTKSPQAFEYFLNPANHAPGTPLDAISYHFYADAEPGESDATQTYTFFARAGAFVDSIRFIESIRHRLSPNTQTHVNEAGCIAADDLAHGAAHTGELPSAKYWSLCGAVFAYLYAELAQQGIDVLGASQLFGYPTQFPSVTLLDWNTGAPNARYRVLQLLHENLGPGDRIVKASIDSPDVYAAAYISQNGKRKILLINKRDHPADVKFTAPLGVKEQHVDLRTAGHPPAEPLRPPALIHLEPLSVMMIVQPSN